jgi:mono/diheme cytochrome c family protein
MRRLLIPAFALLLAGCVGDGDTEVAPATLPEYTPDAFLSFPNMQAPLAAGRYDVEVGPAAGTAPDSFRLLVTHDDGSTQETRGVWGGAPARLAGALALARAGGVRIDVTPGSGAPARIRLLRNGVLVATADGTLDLPLTPVSSVAYARAYYAAVDPEGERETLEEWKARNGFGSDDPAITETHVVFRDALDLGYGRDMYVLRNASTGRIAFFVNNYIVALQPGSPSNYGPINVEAAIAQDPRWFKGSNAIEFSPANEDNFDDPNGAMKIAKFFTFDAGGRRITSADLDGRGVKHMPGMCWACHGGQTLPLLPDGRFPPQSLRSAKLNVLAVADLEFSPQAGFHRSDLEAGLREMNRLVRDSYAEMATRSTSDDATARGHWDPAFALAMLEGRYGSDFSAGTWNEDYVPDGWKDGPGQGGAALLFKRVVAPHCLGCHSLQGRTAASPETALQLGNAVNFSSYAKFMANRERIIDYVYKRGIMPMSLRNFEAFWRDPEGAPSLLAAALGDPSLFDAGRVIQPGRAVARAGADRSVPGPTVTLDGSASGFAARFGWRIVSQPGTGASLSGSTGSRAVLTTTAPGAYVLELTVANGRNTDTDTVTVTVDAAAADPDALTFVDDIRPLIARNNCTSCHAANGTDGIPGFWDDAVDSDSAPLYDRLMARVDLAQPEDSKLLAKPASILHGGGKVIDPATPAGAADYNLLLNWIRAGAVCGTNPAGLDLGCAE